MRTCATMKQNAKEETCISTPTMKQKAKQKLGPKSQNATTEWENIESTAVWLRRRLSTTEVENADIISYDPPDKQGRKVAIKQGAKPAQRRRSQCIVINVVLPHE